MKILMEMFRLILSRSKKAFFRSVCFVLFITGMQIILPLSVRWIVQVVAERQSMQFLLACILGYSILLLVNNLLNVGWTYTLDLLGGEVLQGIRMDLYSALERAEYGKILQIGKEKIKNICYMDTLNLFSSVSVHAMQVLSNTFLIIVFLLISSWINPWLSLVLLIASVLGFLLSMVSRKTISNASMKVNQQMKADNKITNEYVDAIELVKTNELEDYFQDKGKAGLWDFIHTAIQADRVLVFLKKLITDFHQLVSVGISAFLAMSMQGELMAGDLVYYMFVTDIVLSTSQTIETSIYTMLHMAPSFENINQLLEIEEPVGTKTIPRVDRISFEEVSFRYGANHQPVLRGLSAEFRQGDIVRIVGENGSGKSTFLKLLVNLLHPDQGSVKLNGIPIQEISPSILRKEILYIDQDEIFLNDTVENYLNAMAGRKLSSIEIADLKKKVSFDEGITQITENGRSLSGGQRKKLLLMKLLLRYQEASVIILDEIEAGLDWQSKELVLQIEEDIFQQKRDCLVFKITHAEDAGAYNKTVRVGV